MKNNYSIQDNKKGYKLKLLLQKGNFSQTKDPNLGTKTGNKFGTIEIKFESQGTKLFVYKDNLIVNAITLKSSNIRQIDNQLKEGDKYYFYD